MAEGFTNELLFEAVLVGIAALLFAWHDMPLVLAAPIVLLRFMFPILYFAVFCDGTWFMIDDVNYYNDGALMLQQGFNPINVLLSAEGYDALAYSASHHILYQWMNLVAMYFFGDHYYAAVFLNVLFTFISGFLLNRITTMLGFSRNYRIALEAFFLLQWDVVTWSSFVNLKECMIQVITIAGMYCVVRFCLQRDWRSIVGFLVIVQLFYLIRFYLSALMLISTMVWAIWQWRDPRKFLLMPVGCLSFYVAMRGQADGLQLINIGNCIYGFSVVLMAPLPWVQMDDVWWYLSIAAVFHFAFFLPSLLGAWQLWQTNRMARLFIIYLLVVLAFYSIAEVDGMRGSRQRVQLTFIIAWIQFHFLWSMRPSFGKKKLPAMQPAMQLAGPRGMASRPRPAAAPV